MKYRLGFMMIVKLIIAFYALLITTFIFGMEGGILGLVIIAWLIVSAILHFGITAITGLSKQLAERYEENKLQRKKKPKPINSILRHMSSENLLRIRDYLSDDTRDEELLYDELVDDSDLVYQEQKI
jgi:hypothetical protein